MLQIISEWLESCEMLLKEAIRNNIECTENYTYWVTQTLGYICKQFQVYWMFHVTCTRNHNLTAWSKHKHVKNMPLTYDKILLTNKFSMSVLPFCHWQATYTEHFCAPSSRVACFMIPVHSLHPLQGGA